MLLITLQKYSLTEIDLIPPENAKENVVFFCILLVYSYLCARFSVLYNNIKV